MTSIRIGGRRKSRRLGRKSRRLGRKSRRVGRKSRRLGRKSRRLGRQSSRRGAKLDEEIKAITAPRPRLASIPKSGGAAPLLVSLLAQAQLAVEKTDNAKDNVQVVVAYIRKGENVDITKLEAVATTAREAKEAAESVERTAKEAVESVQRTARQLSQLSGTQPQSAGLGAAAQGELHSP